MEGCDSALGCQVGTAPNVDDGVGWTVDICDELSDTVVNTPSDLLCDDGLFCDGNETCDVALGCQVGTNPCVGVCDETGDVCVVPLVTGSPDVAVVLCSTVFEDEDALLDYLDGTCSTSPLGSVPGAADLNAYHPLDDGAQLLSFDVTVTLPGPLTVYPADVVRYEAWAGMQYWILGR